MFNIYFKEMKKFFSLIALVGVFAACNPEDLTTYFTVTPATVTLHATAVCAAPGFTEGDATFNPSQDQSLTGNPSIPAGQFSVSASYKDWKSQTQTIAYPQVLGGANLNLNVVLTIPFNLGGYEYTVEEADVETNYVPKYLEAAAHGHGITTKEVTFKNDFFKVPEQTFEIPMLENANEFILLDSYEDVTYTGAEAVEGSLEILNDDFTEAVNLAWNSVAAQTIEKHVAAKDIKVSAWAIYNVLGVDEEVITTYNIIATPTAGSDAPALSDPIVGSYKLRVLNSGSMYFEFEHPNHAGHYHAGHGHGHGNGSNAGGGLVDAE